MVPEILVWKRRVRRDTVSPYRCGISTHIDDIQTEVVAVAECVSCPVLDRISAAADSVIYNGMPVFRTIHVNI